MALRSNTTISETKAHLSRLKRLLRRAAVRGAFLRVRWMDEYGGIQSITDGLELLLVDDKGNEL